MGHTIFYDVTNACIRSLSNMECWPTVGGSEHEYRTDNSEYANLATTNATTPTAQLTLTQIALGVIGMVSMDNNRNGHSFQNSLYNTSIPLFMSTMPARRPPQVPMTRKNSSDLERPRTLPRLGEISRFLTRIIRHGQRLADGPVLGMSSRCEV